jgi:pimeloyl-ACP methyl ester carboxylesterase
MRSRKFFKILLPFAVIAVVYFLGSAPDDAIFDLSQPNVPADADQLERYIAEKESRHKLKPDNEARIVWFDSARQKTPFSIVYLHGFSATQKEGDPVHRRLARAFGCNLFLSRLSDHGVDTTETLQLFTADRAWSSAKEALAIGMAIGHKVILLSTSTGGTLALKLAAEYPDQVYALINMSPNIAINHPAAFILNDPWGLQISRMVMGGKYRTTGANEEKSRYWNNRYRLESTVELEELVESSMNSETFERITQPSLTLYYYKNEQEQDPEVKVSGMLDMHEQLATPDSLKEAKAMPAAGAHVLGSSITSGDVEGVYAAIEDFLQLKVHMTKK